MLLLWSADFLKKITFSKNSSRNTIRVIKSLDPDQDRHFFGPDLRPNCLQRLSAEDKVAPSNERVKNLEIRRTPPTAYFIKMIIA